MQVECDNPDALLYTQAYVRERLRDADELRRRVAETRHLGDALTGDLLAKNRQTIAGVSVRNPSPSMDPLFLAFLDQPDEVSRVDALLIRLRKTFGNRVNDFRQFLRELQLQPLPHIFELNVHAALDRHFAIYPAPKLSSGRVGDFRITMPDGREVFLEVTVLGESKKSADFTARMLAQRIRHWVGSDDPYQDVMRLVGKLDEELHQVEPGKANVIMVSVQGSHTPEEWLRAAVNELIAGDFSQFRGIVPVNAGALAHVDSIVLCGSRGVRQWIVNSNTDPASSLNEPQRATLQYAFAELEFVRRQ